MVRSLGIVRRADVYLAGSLAAAAAALMIFQLFHSGPPAGKAVDFGFLWIAARMWAVGLDPYAPAYAIVSGNQFEDPTTPYWTWVYPPQWWLVVRPFAALSYDAALFAWRAVCVLSSAVAAALLWRVAARLRPPASPALLLASLAVTLSAEQIGATLYLGQTSLVMLLGLALFVAGAAFGRVLLTALGIAVLMLKPNLGVPVALIALAHPSLRRALPIAAAVTLAGCVPLLAGGLGPFVAALREMLHNLAGYGSPRAFNAPWRMTGLPKLVPAVPALAAAILSGLVGLASLWATLRRHGSDRGALGPALWLNSVAALAGINALHNYDLAFATTPLALAPRLRPAARATLVAGIALIHSARRVARHLVGTEDAVLVLQSSINTAGGLLLLAAAVATAWAGWAAAADGPEPA